MPKPSYRNLLAAFAAFVLAVSGCAGLQETVGMQQFETRSQGFWRAVRWGQFERAAAYLAPGTTAPDPADIKTVKVSDISTGKAEMSEDRTRITYTVTYRFYLADALVEHSQTVEQVWRYDPQFRNWFLKSGFPAFSPSD